MVPVLQSIHFQVRELLGKQHELALVKSATFLPVARGHDGVFPSWLHPCEICAPT